MSKWTDANVAKRPVADISNRAQKMGLLANFEGVYAAHFYTLNIYKYIVRKQVYGSRNLRTSLLSITKLTIKAILVCLLIIPTISACSNKSERDKNLIPVSIVTINSNIDKKDAEKIRENIIFSVLNGDIEIPITLVEDDMDSRTFVFLLGSECEQAVIDAERIFLLASGNSEIKIQTKSLVNVCTSYQGM